jgi:predicted acyl esterase
VALLARADGPQRLANTAPQLARVLDQATPRPAPRFDESEIQCETVMVAMRDGIRLATDLWLPPVVPAPAVALRTAYGRALPHRQQTFLTLARHGYVVVSQDCRGTGDSEPDHWDYYVYEREDGYDFVDWVRRQEWFAGFLGSLGGSYDAGTQWGMALHPAMSTIVPRVGGLGVAPTTRPRFHMFMNAYARTVGHGAEAGERDESVMASLEQAERDMADETLATGYFNEPLYRPFSEELLKRLPELRSLPPSAAQRRLYAYYSRLPPAERAELIKVALGVQRVTAMAVEALPDVFGHWVSCDAHVVPRQSESELARSIQAPPLIITAWYDWFLDDPLASWDLITREAREPVRSRSRLLITPTAHNKPGYREGREDHPELDRSFSFTDTIELWLEWYRAVRDDEVDSWPTVIYYLMGANEWCTASAWPPPEAQTHELYLGADGSLTANVPAAASEPDHYTYDPENPTPTLGGSIVSSVYTPGSVDVSDVQRRPDVVTYTTDVLEHDLDVVGPVRLILYASSSASDTDFSARLTDVFPDGRAIQLQHVSLRTRYRNPNGVAELLDPGRIYRFEIDMWATANRFRQGHRLRLDLSSADFPRYDRNTNRGGEPGPPIRARQTIYHDAEHASHLLLPIIGVPKSAPTGGTDER